MKKLILACLWLLLLVPLAVQCADEPPVIATSSGSCDLNYYRSGDITGIGITWTSTSGGAAAATVYNLYGDIQVVAFDPISASGNYDITLTDFAGVDVLKGDHTTSLGTNLSATVTTAGRPLYSEVIGSATTHHPVTVAGTYTFTVAQAGASKQGKFWLVLRE